MMEFKATRDERTKACWKMQDCGSCINSKHGCGWCSSSFSCVPANSLLDPVSQHGICPLASARFELRTKTLGCGCSTATLLSVIVTVFATIAALLLLYAIGLALKNLNPYLGSGQTAGWQIEVKHDGTTVAHECYIIENYDRLPASVIFSHSKRYQWHNDDPLYDGQAVLRRLNMSYVESVGYASLRCCLTLGCPVEIKPLRQAEDEHPVSDPDSPKARAGSFFKAAFEDMFPGQPVPEEIGASCCAQFAVTGDTIRQRPRADYERYRDWLLNTPLRDDLRGGIMEYSWHRWPDMNWDNQWRNVTTLVSQFEHENT
ncbi:hypothetical protein AC579_4939 [Pseudocercospora musae]|uniref:PSI domain-containing protein n=1 Tax=Pseudocercospora musae TaxID=113226 RepID=A0A139I8U2_9PEZI|nr:hypothetical protein AC579_4939 [Pseudocercospora musae]